MQCSTLSIPLSQEIIKAKIELKRVFEINVNLRYINALELHCILPDALKLSGGGTVQWFRDNSYLLRLNNLDEVKSQKNMGIAS